MRAFCKVRWLPFALLTVYMLIWHFSRTMYISDDIWFFGVLGDGASFRDWTAFLAGRYHNWTSRLLIESILILLIRLPLLWRILDTVVMVWIAVGISRFCNPQRNVCVDWAIAGMFLLFPLHIMGSSGWITCSLNYSWPLAMGFVALLPLRRMLDGEQIRRWEYLLAIPALLYAANQEQMCAVMLAICMAFTGYLRWRDGRIPLFLAAETILVVAEMLFILTCPGNALRSVSELAFFPEFTELSLLGKLWLGSAVTLRQLFFQTNWLFLVLCCLLVFLVYRRSGRLLTRMAAIFPLGYSLLARAITDPLGQIDETGKTTAVLPVLLMIAACFCVLYCIWVVADRKRDALCIAFLIILGGGTRAMLGFSPSIWHTGDRAGFFLYVSLIAAISLLCSPVCQPKSAV